MSQQEKPTYTTDPAASPPRLPATLRLGAVHLTISDHGTHETIYLPDSDVNGIELAADRPRETWPKPLNFVGGIQPLDLDDLLR